MTTEKSRFEKVGASLPDGFDRTREEIKFKLFGRDFLVVILTQSGTRTDEHILLMEKSDDQRWCSIYVNLNVVSLMSEIKFKSGWCDYELIMFLSDVATTEKTFDVYDVLEKHLDNYEIMERM